MNRRKFLKATGIAVAGVGMGLGGVDIVYGPGAEWRFRDTDTLLTHHRRNIATG